MPLLTHGGRIVPILTGQQHGPPDSTMESVLERSSPVYSPLLDQRDATLLRQQKNVDLESLEMPCLQERGLYALPTEGDGKSTPLITPSNPFLYDV